MDSANRVAGPSPEFSGKKTLRKPDKLRFRSEFGHVRESGTKYVGKALLAVTAPAPDGKLRCGVICSKKYSLLAVERNRARRLLWESFRMLKNQVAVCHLVLIPRRRIATWKRGEVTRELAELLIQSGVLPPGAADSLPVD